MTWRITIQKLLKVFITALAGLLGQRIRSHAKTNGLFKHPANRYNRYQLGPPHGTGYRDDNMSGHGELLMIQLRYTVRAEPSI